MIGTHLSNLLSDSGFRIVVFTRNPDKRRKYIKNTEYAKWDPRKNIIDRDALSKIDVLVHMAGEGIADKRWTEQRKTEIVDSRVIGTQFIVQQLKENAPQCKVFIGTSAIGYYGNDENGTHPFTEEAPPSKDFLGHTCQKWEAASEDVGENVRIFPISNWTELDVWNYIREEKLAIPSIYYAHFREVIERDNMLWPYSDFLNTTPEEIPYLEQVRFRTVGDMTCTAAVASAADQVEGIIEEILAAKISERGARIDDKRSEAAMEQRKKEGYF